MWAPLQVLQLLNVIWYIAGRRLPSGMEYPESEMESFAHGVEAFAAGKRIALFGLYGW